MLQHTEPLVRQHHRDQGQGSRLLDTPNANVIELRGIVKRFPGVVANDGIDLAINRGEIHCLLGENGAGKTTLMRILYGLYQPDEDEIRLFGQPVTLSTRRRRRTASHSDRSS
jgi:ABC-type uncharacterized transport system ATPase subunit